MESRFFSFGSPKQSKESKKDKETAKYETNSTPDLSADRNQGMGWRECVCLSFRLVLIDLLWGILVAVIALSLVSLRQNIPNYELCNLLQRESGSSKDFSLPMVNYITKMIWVWPYYSISLITFFLLTEYSKDQSLWNSVKTLNKRWKKLIHLSFFFAGMDTLYRLFGYFAFSFNKKAHNYPTWYLLPLNLNWIFATSVVAFVSAKIWAAKQSSCLILQHNVPQQMVLQHPNKVHYALNKKMIMSTVLPSMNAILVQHLLLQFQVSKESHRATLIVIILVLCYPLWLILDRCAKKSLPWSKQIRSRINSSNNRIHSLNPYEQSDPILSNGFILSGSILSGTIVVLRILQANMATLASKLATGVLASLLESFVVVAKPHLNRKMKKAAQNMKRIVSSHIVPFGVDNSIDVEIEESNERVYRWQRAHTIVYVNRIEMFSIIFSHFLMMMSVRVKDRAIGLEGGKKLQECSSSTVRDFFISMIILCLLEVLIESCTYIYLLRVEKLELRQATNRFRFKFCFIYFLVITVMYFVNIFLTMSYTILSCDGMSESFYNYHCD